MVWAVDESGTWSLIWSRLSEGGFLKLDLLDIFPEKISFYNIYEII